MHTLFPPHEYTLSHTSGANLLGHIAYPKFYLIGVYLRMMTDDSVCD